MLKQRVLTALVLIPLVVGIVLFLPTVVFAVLFGLVATLGAWEWSQFLRFRALWLRTLFTAIVFVLLFLCWRMLDMHYRVILFIEVGAIVWWLIALVLVMSYPKYERLRSNRLFGVAACLLTIVPSWLALVAVHYSSGQGPALVLYMLVLIWIADSGAYFGGRRWGRNKLSPQVSPGKSWEGVLAGLVVAGIYAALFGAYFQFGTDNVSTVGEFLGISLLVAIFSVLGDLTESMFKRQAGVKDSGTLLPGHGGALDRIDSITAAAPVFAVCLWLFLGFNLLNQYSGH